MNPTTVGYKILFVVFFIFQIACSLPQYEAHDINDVKKGDQSEKTKPYLWFGPRLGRRKRNPNSVSVDEILHNFEDIGEDFDGIPLTLILVRGKDFRRRGANFSPRLARDSVEEIIHNAPGDRWYQDPELLNEFLSQRSPPFAPRLGRHLAHQNYNN